MALVGMQDVSVGFGGPPLLEHINVQIEPGERICLIGRNGSGKTTLMRLIAGELAASGGALSRSPGLRVCGLAQEVPGGLTGTVFDQVSAGLGERGGLLAEYHLVSHRVATEGHDPKLLEQLDKLQHELDRDNGWQMHLQVERILEKMQLDADASFDSLSAGMKRRVLLAKAIVLEPDILLLDEPTNHLDIEAIEWLEEFLTRYAGTLIFVSHDREFLKRVAVRIFDLDRGRLTSYRCDYETYVTRKLAALEVEATEQALFDKKLAQEEVWIRKGIKARRTRNEGRVRALKKMRQERANRKELVGTVKLTMQDTAASGRLVIEAKEVSFGYTADRKIIRDFSTAIMRGDKVGIIGPNGSGKTTLLRVLLGELAVNGGTVRQGTNLEIAYFDQLHRQLDHSKTVQQNVADGNETIMINGAPRHVIGYLQDFLFTPTQCRNAVADLSGGERNRLLLAKLFTRPSNVLVLDEPTNDLDIETLDLLEEYLLDYPGTILMVSHDRAFLNNVVTSTMVLEGDGVVKEYVGGYDDWVRQREASAATKREAQRLAEATKPATKNVTPPPPSAKNDQPKRLSYKEKQELAALPGQIEQLETEQAQLHATMADPEFYKKGAAAITAATDRLAAVEKQRQELYSRWEALELRQSAAQ